jgi:hypothetical protein
MSFVESASRNPGASGSQLSVLRVNRNVKSGRITRQAAYDSPVFERFTERARQVIVLAQEEARGLKHGYIGTEHLLLGLLREEQGVAAQALDGLGVKIEEVRARVAQIVGERDEVTSGQIPFTPRSKKVLELGLREALRLGHNYIDTEHILFGLVREGEGVAVQIMADAGAPVDRVRLAVEGALGETGWESLRRSIKKVDGLRQAVEPFLGLSTQEVLDAIGSAQAAAIAVQDVARAIELTDIEGKVLVALRAVQTVLAKGGLGEELPRSDDPEGRI